MPSSSQFFSFTLSLLLAFPLIAQETVLPPTSNDLSSTPPPVAVAVAVPQPEPARVSRLTFLRNVDQIREKIIVTVSPNFVRVDEPEERLTVIYNVATQLFIGLEHSNDTTWKFSWPEIQTAVQKSMRYQNRLRSLNSDGLDNYTTPPDSNMVAAAQDLPEAPRVVWQMKDDKKVIAGLPTTHWEGTNAQGDTLEAWCTAGSPPTLALSLRRLREINEPMALVPIRELVPPSVFPVYDTLSKGGNTPVEIDWGTQRSGSSFSLIKMEMVPNEPGLYTVPNYYTRTTLITLDGIVKPESTQNPSQK